MVSHACATPRILRDNCIFIQYHEADPSNTPGRGFWLATDQRAPEPTNERTNGGTREPARPISSYRVAKKFASEQSRAIRLARHHGDALVCVRHRHDPTGPHRIVTVELVLEQVPIARRPGLIVGVRIGYGERELRAAARAGGATWDREARLWRMPRSVARSLGLLGRVTGR